jgi:hypothetical protein
MRHAGNFNPEWGYLAPAPSFMRTARGFIVAALVGGTAGAAVVLSLMDRPAAETSVAARTLVSAVEPPAPVRPAESTPSADAPTVAQPQPAPVAASPAPRRDASVVTAPQQAATTLGHADLGHAGLGHAGLGHAGDAGGAVMNRRAPAAAALAEVPRIMAAEVPAGRPAIAENAVVPAPAAEAAAAPAAAPAIRTPVKRRVVGRVGPRYAGPRYDARPYAFLRPYGQYGGYGQEY